MNLKRIFLTAAALFWVGTAAFAEISVKDLGDGNVDITFVYKDDTASEMGVIGSFNNWTQPGDMMAKNAAGLWEKTIRATSGDSISYKFLSKGTWIFDEMAPDKKDDGYGGNNGFIPVADILSGVLPAVPGAAPVVVKGAKKPLNQRPRATFGTETYLESDTLLNTNKGASDVVISSINAKSVWKITGDLVPGMPGNLEITAFNGHPQLGDRSNPVNGNDAFSSGILFNPFYYLGGDKKPVLDKVSFGFDAPWLSYQTGYGNAVLPSHKSILWETVPDDVLAADGYSSFRLGNKARTLGDFTFDAGIVPNKSNVGFVGDFGLYTFASIEAYGVKLEGQYDLRSSPAATPNNYFNRPSRQDFIGAAEVFFLDGFTAKGQFLLPKFTFGGAIDARPLTEKVAGKAVVGYSDYYGDYEVMVGYGFRGSSAAQMLYAKNDDVLGEVSTHQLGLDGFYKFGYWGTAKLSSQAVVSSYRLFNGNLALTGRPGFAVDFDKLNLGKIKAEVYVSGTSNSKPDAGVDSLVFNAAGGRLSFGDLLGGMIDSLDLNYRLDDQEFQTLLAEAKRGAVTAQAGLALRGGQAPNNPVGIVLGAHYELPFPEARTPSVYVQYVSNMDPYNKEGSFDYDLTDFGPSNGSAGSDGFGAFRFGIRWNY